MLFINLRVTIPFIVTKLYSKYLCILCMFKWMLLIPCCIHENYFLNNQGNTNLLFEIPCKRFWKILYDVNHSKQVWKLLTTKDFNCLLWKHFCPVRHAKTFFIAYNFFSKLFWSHERISTVLRLKWILIEFHVLEIQRFNIELKSWNH